MKVYQSRIPRLSGSDFREVNAKARLLYQKIKSKSKRRPYIRSAYFKKEKIFLELFWIHLFEKSNWRDRVRRLKYFSCALDLLQNSRFHPNSKENPNKKSELLHRFAGLSKEGDLFYVQIKEDKKTKQKWFMSVFPE